MRLSYVLLVGFGASNSILADCPDLYFSCQQKAISKDKNLLSSESVLLSQAELEAIQAEMSRLHQLRSSETIAKKERIAFEKAAGFVRVGQSWGLYGCKPDLGENETLQSRATKLCLDQHDYDLYYKKYVIAIPIIPATDVSLFRGSKKMKNETAVTATFSTEILERYIQENTGSVGKLKALYDSLRQKGGKNGLKAELSSFYVACPELIPQRSDQNQNVKQIQWDYLCAKATKLVEAYLAKKLSKGSSGISLEDQATLESLVGKTLTFMPNKVTDRSSLALMDPFASSTMKLTPTEYFAAVNAASEKMLKSSGNRLAGWY